MFPILPSLICYCGLVSQDLSNFEITSKPVRLYVRYFINKALHDVAVILSRRRALQQPWAKQNIKPIVQESERNIKKITVSCPSDSVSLVDYTL